MSVEKALLAQPWAPPTQRQECRNRGYRCPLRPRTSRCRRGLRPDDLPLGVGWWGGVEHQPLVSRTGSVGKGALVWPPQAHLGGIDEKAHDDADND